MNAAQTPEQLHQELARAYGERDLDRLVALFEADATLVPQPGALARGPEEIRAALSGFLQLGGVMAVETVEIVPAGDCALTRSVWSIIEDGRTKISAHGVEILRKRADGTWRFLLDHPFGGGDQQAQP
ncbi:SgcJ/EcaC family oxidoreductase [Sphingobium sp. AS12]|uniref:YybH family protein n=1 Tax=Sphingobium sp. AS12 TaxID=2849495 RepID=UPI001C3194FF|nr:SgcJ/EcaC family oxidoreductase [Sphingobium sp. AS12]MBV2150120.1 SgcJ/EcaC family oxidoreductase [Sphingobium sp. AS12]